MTTIVRAGWVLTMDADRAGGQAIADGAVMIDGDRIVDVGPFVEVAARHGDATVVGDGTGVVTPGFVNTHTHLSEGLVRGMGETWTLYEWGSRVVGPAGRHLTREMGAVGGTLACLEAALSGVTTVADMFCHGNPGSMASLGAADAVDHVGLRAVLSFGPEDLGYPDLVPGPATTATMVEEHVALAERCAAGPLTTFRVGLGTINGQSDDLLAATVALARNGGWSIHTHLHEVREEVTDGRLTHGRTPLERLLLAGGFDAGVLAAHAIWLTPAEIDVLLASEATIAHNPIANMILADGVCPVGALRSAGLAVGIGTDGAASNDSQNMLEAIKGAALLQKVTHHDPRVLSAHDVLAMATIEGAAALRLDHEIGSLAVGKQADLVRFGGDSPSLAIIHDAVQAVVHATNPRDVTDVWVAGRRVVNGGRVEHVDVAGLAARARELGSVLARQAGLPSVLAER
jgi:5-methylthioadenosine/S-adenosylhomocysteine deaminase